MAACAGSQPLGDRVLDAKPFGEQRRTRRTGQTGNHHAGRGNGCQTTVALRDAHRDGRGAALGQHSGSPRLVQAKQMTQAQHAKNTGQTSGSTPQPVSYTHLDVYKRQHFDLLTKYNEEDRLFDTSSRAYRHAALEALEAVLEQDAIIEVNTGAIARGCRVTPYPAPFLLREIAQKGGRVTLTSDSHSPATVVFGYRQALELLRSCGIQSLWVLSPSGFREEEI